VQDTNLIISANSVSGSTGGYNVGFTEDTIVNKLTVYGHATKDTVMTVKDNPAGRHTVLQDLYGDGMFVLEDTRNLMSSSYLEMDGGSGTNGVKADLVVADDLFHTTFALNGVVHHDGTGNHTAVLRNIQQRTWRVHAKAGVTGNTTLTNAQTGVNTLVETMGVAGSKMVHTLSGSERGAETRYQIRGEGEHVVHIGRVHRLHDFAGVVHVYGDDPKEVPGQKLHIIVHAAQDQRTLRAELRRGVLSILDANDDQTIFRVIHAHVDTLEVHFGTGGTELDVDHGEHGDHATEHLLFFNSPTADGSDSRSSNRGESTPSSRLRNIAHVQRWTAPVAIFNAHEVHTGLRPLGSKTIPANDCTAQGSNCVYHPLQGGKSLLAVAGNATMTSTRVTFRSGSSSSAPAQHFSIDDGCINMATRGIANWRLEEEQGSVVATQSPPPSPPSNHSAPSPPSPSPRATAAFCAALATTGLFPADICDRPACAVAYGAGTVDLHVESGGDEDHVYVSGVRAKTVSVHTNEGRDRVYVRDSSAANHTYIQLGAGDDRFTGVYPLSESTLDLGNVQRDADVFDMFMGGDDHVPLSTGAKTCGVGGGDGGNCITLTSVKRHDKIATRRESLVQKVVGHIPLVIAPGISGYPTPPPFDDVSPANNRISPSASNPADGSTFQDGEFHYFVTGCDGKPFVRVPLIGAGNHTVHISAGESTNDSPALDCGVRVVGDHFKNQTSTVVVDASRFTRHITLHSDRGSLHAVDTAAGYRRFVVNYEQVEMLRTVMACHDDGFEVNFASGTAQTEAIYTCSDSTRTLTNANSPVPKVVNARSVAGATVVAMPPPLFVHIGQQLNENAPLDPGVFINHMLAIVNTMNTNVADNSAHQAGERKLRGPSTLSQLSMNAGFSDSFVGAQRFRVNGGCISKADQSADRHAPKLPPSTLYIRFPPTPRFCRMLAGLGLPDDACAQNCTVIHGDGYEVNAQFGAGEEDLQGIGAIAKWTVDTGAGSDHVGWAATDHPLSLSMRSGNDLFRGTAPLGETVARMRDSSSTASSIRYPEDVKAVELVDQVGVSLSYNTVRMEGGGADGTTAQEEAIQIGPVGSEKSRASGALPSFVTLLGLMTSTADGAGQQTRHLHDKVRVLRARADVKGQEQVLSPPKKPQPESPGYPPQYRTTLAVGPGSVFPVEDIFPDQLLVLDELGAEALPTLFANGKNCKPPVTPCPSPPATNWTILIDARNTSTFSLDEPKSVDIFGTKGTNGLVKILLPDGLAADRLVTVQKTKTTAVASVIVNMVNIFIQGADHIAIVAEGEMTVDVKEGTPGNADLLIAAAKGAIVTGLQTVLPPATVAVANCENCVLPAWSGVPFLLLGGNGTIDLADPTHHSEQSISMVDGCVKFGSPPAADQGSRSVWLNAEVNMRGVPTSTFAANSLQCNVYLNDTNRFSVKGVATMASTDVSPFTNSLVLPGASAVSVMITRDPAEGLRRGKWSLDAPAVTSLALSTSYRQWAGRVATVASDGSLSVSFGSVAAAAKTNGESTTGKAAVLASMKASGQGMRGVSLAFGKVAPQSSSDDFTYNVAIAASGAGQPAVVTTATWASVTAACNAGVASSPTPWTFSTAPPSLAVDAPSSPPASNQIGQIGQGWSQAASKKVISWNMPKACGGSVVLDNAAVSECPPVYLTTTARAGAGAGGRLAVDVDVPTLRAGSVSRSMSVLPTQLKVQDGTAGAGGGAIMPDRVSVQWSAAFQTSLRSVQLKDGHTYVNAFNGAEHPDDKQSNPIPVVHVARSANVDVATTGTVQMAYALLFDPMHKTVTEDTKGGAAKAGANKFCLGATSCEETAWLDAVIYGRNVCLSEAKDDACVANAVVELVFDPGRVPQRPNAGTALMCMGRKRVVNGKEQQTRQVLTLSTNASSASSGGEGEYPTVPSAKVVAAVVYAVAVFIVVLSWTLYRTVRVELYGPCLAVAFTGQLGGPAATSVLNRVANEVVSALLTGWHCGAGGVEDDSVSSMVVTVAFFLLTVVALVLTLVSRVRPKWNWVKVGRRLCCAIAFFVLVPFMMLRVSVTAVTPIMIIFLLVLCILVSMMAGADTDHVSWQDTKTNIRKLVRATAANDDVDGDNGDDNGDAAGDHYNGHTRGNHREDASEGGSRSALFCVILAVIIMSSFQHSVSVPGQTFACVVLLLLTVVAPNLLQLQHSFSSCNEGEDGAGELICLRCCGANRCCAGCGRCCQSLKPARIAVAVIITVAFICLVSVDTSENVLASVTLCWVLCGGVFEAILWWRYRRHNICRRRGAERNDVKYESIIPGVYQSHEQKLRCDSAGSSNESGVDFVEMPEVTGRVGAIQ
jgi:hypothetical protein